MNFSQQLESLTSNYEGDYEHLIKYSPELYRLLSRLLEIPEISEVHRLRVLATIGYFIIPQDVYPEKDLGALGFLDDVILCLHTLKDIERNYTIDAIIDFWSGDIEELNKLLNEDFKSLVAEHSDMYNDIIEFVGFNRTY